MSRPRYKTLLIEDNPAEARRIRELLADENKIGGVFDLECFGRLAPALVRLSKGDVDAVLLDLSLPDSQGPETFTRVSAQAPGVAMIILSEPGNDEMVFSKLNQGLPDYLPKALIDAPLLSRAIRYAIEGKRVEREFGQLREELQRLARSHRIELEAVDRELATFSYSVSHELQNSLQGITGFSQILISEYGAQIPAQAQQFLQMLNDGAQEMKLLVEGLLSFSRLSCQPLNKEPVKLSVLVLKVLDRFGPEREKRKVKVRLGNLADCIANPPLLDQMFTHLLSNAFKFTRRREKAIIEIGCFRNRLEIIYFIRDNGAGFDMQYVSQLFGFCQRLHPTSEFEGKGVGLAIAQRIVHRHDGRIWAEAGPDQGATFYFTLSSSPVSITSSVSPADPTLIKTAREHAL